jgi:anti-sigma factor RsiW
MANTQSKYMMSVSCKRIHPLLARYADGALEPMYQEGVERHVGSCTACASILEEYRALNAYVRAPQPVGPSPYMWQRIHRTLTRTQDRQRIGLFARLRPALIPIVGAAVVTVAVFTASLLSRAIVRAGQDAAVQTINVQPEDGRAAVSQESVPFVPLDTLEDEE